MLIIDSHGRAWRLGTVGTAIGISGFPGLVDLRGTLDMFGEELLNTEVGAADEKAPAKNQGACHRSLEEEVVEQAFDDLKTLSRLLRQRFGR